MSFVGSRMAFSLAAYVVGSRAWRGRIRSTDEWQMRPIACRWSSLEQLRAIFGQARKSRTRQVPLRYNRQQGSFAYWGFFNDLHEIRYFEMVTDKFLHCSIFFLMSSISCSLAAL
jgi:hypothetical protein